jgi:hypothetical protein
MTTFTENPELRKLIGKRYTFFSGGHSIDFIIDSVIETDVDMYEISGKQDKIMSFSNAQFYNDRPSVDITKDELMKLLG